MSEIESPEPPEIVLDDAEFNKHFAQRVLARLDHNNRFAAEQVASTAKWLNASVLAVNGAGALAAVNAFKDGGSWMPGLMFTTGIAFALLSGVAMQEIYNGAGEPLLEHDNYWTEVAHRGGRDAHIETQLEEASNKAMKFALLPPILGWCSGLLFLAGAILLAVGVTRGENVHDRRCLALQRDMLSPHPKRGDSVELFKVLGCRPSA